MSIKRILLLVSTATLTFSSSVFAFDSWSNATFGVTGTVGEISSDSKDGNVRFSFEVKIPASKSSVPVGSGISSTLGNGGQIPPGNLPVSAPVSAPVGGPFYKGSAGNCTAGPSGPPYFSITNSGYSTAGTVQQQKQELWKSMLLLAKSNGSKVSADVGANCELWDLRVH